MQPAIAKAPDACPIFDPISIGLLARIVIADCLRKWMDGDKLTDEERAVINATIAANDIAIRAQAVDARP